MEEELERDMTPKLIGETWRKYPTDTSKYKSTYGLFQCQYCGKEFETNIQSVRRGRTKSCGCIVGNTTHGLKSNIFYGTWYNMNKRCNNPEDKDYPSYGGRGIKVCDEWLDIAIFIKWAEATHPKTEGLSLDRIDVEGNYEPNNCRWADRTTQALNKRMMRTNTSGFVGVYSGVSKDGWYAKVGSNNKLKHIGYYETLEKAVQARDNYIIEHNLPHKLSTDYKREEA
jgi:hypothetical protein